MVITADEERERNRESYEKDLAYISADTSQHLVCW